MILPRYSTLRSQNPQGCLQQVVQLKNWELGSLDQAAETRDMVVQAPTTNGSGKPMWKWSF